MSSKSENGFVRIKDRVPYHGKGVDELIGAIRRLFADPANKYAQKIVFEVGVPHIYIEKMVPEGEMPDIPELSIHDIIRNTSMEEFDSDGEQLTPMQQLWGMFEMIQDKGLQAAFVVAGNKTKFQKWLGVRISHTKPAVLGTPFQVLGDLPEDVFIICAARSRVADVEDIQYSVKGSL